MERVCEFCNKKYIWEENQHNWGKNGPKDGKGTVNSKRFCSYYCGTQYVVAKREKTKLDKYGDRNYINLEKNKKTCEERYGSSYFFQTQNFKNKSKETCLNKYGVEHSFQDKGVQEKYKQTCLRKYGKDNIGQFGTEEHKKAIKEKYGVTHISQSNQIQDKKKQIYLNKYGVEYISQSNEIKNKIKETCLERYGVEYPSQSNQIKNKVKETCINKYGVEYSLKSKKIRNKIKQTLINNYNVDNYAKTPEFKNLFKDDDWVKNVQQKIYTTKQKNKSFKISKDEIEIYTLLLQKFGKDNIKWQYRSKEYPFTCDFYIKSMNLYIEYQRNWTHGGIPYNKDNKDHQKLLQLWVNKSQEINFKNKKKNYYMQAIYVWTKLDPKKRQIVKDNNLNWLEFFNLNQFYKWYKKEDNNGTEK